MTERQPGQMLLTDQDIVKMTGYKMPRSQREIMLKWGLPYRVRNNGTIMTTWPAINNALQTLSISGQIWRHLETGETRAVVSNVIWSAGDPGIEIDFGSNKLGYPFARPWLP